MNIEIEKIRSYRLHAHHLDMKSPITILESVAGACGLQNSPPGAWETALWNRLDDCSLQTLHDALYQQKLLLQAWSYRGVPVVFPTSQSDVFLSPLIAQMGEQPWIYTRGITAALDFMQMKFDDLLPMVKEATKYLNNHTVKSKEALDRTLAEIVETHLPQEKRPLWRAPSMYGAPDRQTVGGAVVSLLLRPCSFSSLVVFGERQGVSPTFTSFQNWIGHVPDKLPEAEKILMRKFLHCYGPTTMADFMNWLGCSTQQAKRLWSCIANELEPVQVEGKTRFMLSSDIQELFSAGACEENWRLLGAHDPYLDMKDRTVLLENKSLHKLVWKTVANPGVIIKRGCIEGIWAIKTVKDRLNISMTTWEPISSQDRQKLESLAEGYAAFRLLSLQKCTIGSIS